MDIPGLWFSIVKKWEGDVGNRPSKEDSGGLTNHGVTIGTWKLMGAKIVGKPPTVEGLLSLTWDEASKIAQVGFWTKNNINKIRNSALRPIVADAFWMSGYHALPSLGYTSISDLNKDIFATPSKLYKKRLAWLKTLSNWPYNANGWTNRLNDILTVAKKIATRNRLYIAGAGVTVAIGTTLLILHYRKKNNGIRKLT
jgi:lysozyme family protein